MLKALLVLLLFTQPDRHPEPVAPTPPAGEALTITRTLTRQHHLNEGEAVQVLRICRRYDDLLATATPEEVETLRQRRTAELMHVVQAAKHE